MGEWRGVSATYCGLQMKNGNVDVAYLEELWDMSIVSNVYDDLKLIVTVHHGDVSDEQCIEQYRQLFDSVPDFVKYDKLVDTREASSETRSPACLRMIVELMQDRFSTTLSSTRTAIVASDDLGYGMARMYRAYRRLLPGQVEVFRGLESAAGWLGIDTCHLTSLNLKLPAII